nr:hypothetical protein JVH1_3819 [Rhodococcus sp. JVH1]
MLHRITLGADGVLVRFRLASTNAHIAIVATTRRPRSGCNRRLVSRVIEAGDGE